MPDKAWKKFERRVARFFGGKRNALSGRNSGAAMADVVHPRLTIECKQRKSHAVLRTWDQCAKEAKQEGEGKVPVVALSEAHRPGFWLVVYSGDLEQVATEAAIAHQRLRIANLRPGSEE